MVAHVPTGNPLMSNLDGKMSNEENSYAYESGDDDESEEDDVELPRKKRCCGLSWEVIAFHQRFIQRCYQLSQA